MDQREEVYKARQAANRTVKPVTPDEVDKGRVIPDFVIQAFNEEISKVWDGDCATVFQEDVTANIRTKCNTRWEQWWLDVEPLYRQNGWKVVYDKPGFNEIGRASYTFTRDKDHKTCLHPMDS